METYFSICMKIKNTSRQRDNKVSVDFIAREPRGLS